MSTIGHSKIQSSKSQLSYPWHQSTWLNFINARKQHHLPHAILLSGEEGIGKLDLAERMAKSLLCINTMTAADDACHQCQSCKTYESGANPDYTHIGLLEDKKQIGVDQIRELSEFLNYSRSFNIHRVVIINPVERMNINAANSLLKSLEEPTSNTIIILVTAKLSDLLATIKSRCQLLLVNSPSKDETISWITEYQSQDQNVSLEPELIYDLIGAKPCYAKRITQQDIVDKSNFFKQLQSLLKHDISISEMAKNWEKYDHERLIDWQIISIQNTLKASYLKSGENKSSVTNNQKIVHQLSDAQQWALYHSLIKQKQYIHTSVNPLMFMENMLMLWLKAS